MLIFRIQQGIRATGASTISECTQATVELLFKRAGKASYAAYMLANKVSPPRLGIASYNCVALNDTAS